MLYYSDLTFLNAWYPPTSQSMTAMLNELKKSYLYLEHEPNFIPKPMVNDVARIIHACILMFRYIEW